MCVFFCAAAMEELVCELRLFLDLLDREYLSAGVRERKMHLSNILHRVLSDKGETEATLHHEPLQNTVEPSGVVKSIIRCLALNACSDILQTSTGRFTTLKYTQG